MLYPADDDDDDAKFRKIKKLLLWRQLIKIHEQATLEVRRLDKSHLAQKYWQTLFGPQWYRIITRHLAKRYHTLMTFGQKYFFGRQCCRINRRHLTKRGYPQMTFGLKHFFGGQMSLSSMQWPRYLAWCWLFLIIMMIILRKMCHLTE